MKTIGLLGGMSWESSSEYYRILNQEARSRLGGLHSARVLMHSVDFADLQPLLAAGEWDAIAEILARAARGLQDAGADCILICTNTMHIVADAVRSVLNVPLVHVAEVIAGAVQEAAMMRVGLLGTRPTMESTLYVEILSGKGIEAIVPSEEDRVTVHRVIFEELVRGIVRDTSRKEYARIMEKLAADGARGIILGCTEIPLLVGPEHSPLPLFDSTRLHALAAMDFALS